VNRWLHKHAPECTIVAHTLPTLAGLATLRTKHEMCTLDALLVDAQDTIDPSFFEKAKGFLRTGGILAARGLDSKEKKTFLYQAAGGRFGIHVCRQEGDITWTRITRMNGASTIRTANIPFEQYITWLHERKPFAYLRYGDGEWNAILETGFPGYGFQQRTPKLTEDTKRSILEYFDEPRYILARPTWHHFIGRIPYWELIAAFLKKHGLDDITWTFSNTFIAAQGQGKLWPFIAALREHRIVLVAKKRYASLADEALPGLNHVVIPPKNCHSRIREIEAEILAQDLPAVVLVSAGPAAVGLIHSLYKKTGGKSTLIDIGSLWGSLIGWPEHGGDPILINQARRRNLGYGTD